MTAVAGINHITLACDDLDVAVAFYRDVLGCRILARWPAGAYLLAGDTWLALVLRQDPDSDYSHIAFDVTPDAMEGLCARLDDSRAPRWQANWTEGDSVYFTDPSGHRLEVHATTLRARLAAARREPWEGLELVEDGLPLRSPLGVAGNGRRFSCYAVGVDIYLVDADDRFLLLRHPVQGGFEVVNGGVEADETLAEAAMREVAEEAGAGVRIRLLAPFDVGNHDYFGLPLISIGYVAEYLGGEVAPGDDMAGSEVLWATAGDIEEQALPLTVPQEAEAFRRALEVARIWRAAR